MTHSVEGNDGRGKSSWLAAALVSEIPAHKVVRDPRHRFSSHG